MLFQIPEWSLVALILLGVHNYTEAPAWLLVAGAVGFAVKDVLLYPWMKRAYEKVGADPGEHLVGRLATVVEGLKPHGWVRVNAELWRAVADHGEIETGAAVRVEALEGHELRVVRVGPEGAATTPPEGSAP